MLLWVRLAVSRSKLWCERPDTNPNTNKYMLGWFVWYSLFYSLPNTITSCAPGLLNIELFSWTLENMRAGQCWGQVALSDIPVVDCDNLHWHIVQYCGILHWHIVARNLRYWEHCWHFVIFSGCFPSPIWQWFIKEKTATITFKIPRSDF